MGYLSSGPFYDSGMEKATYLAPTVSEWQPDPVGTKMSFRTTSNFRATQMCPPTHDTEFWAHPEALWLCLLPGQDTLWYKVERL